jgi:hypothetical protein
MAYLSAPPQGERTRQHRNERGKERKDETCHDRVSARAEAIDRARCRVYLGVNLEIVWAVVEKELPKLAEAIRWFLDT